MNSPIRWNYANFQLKTARGTLRAWREEDTDQAFIIYGDPVVARYLSGTPEESLESMRDSIRRSIRMSEAYPEGMGSFALEIEDEVVGCGMLKPIPLTENWDDWKRFRFEGGPVPAYEEIEVGWHLRPTHWGQGLATEVGSALLDYGFGKLGLPEIIAVMNPENVASHRVAERLGMVPSGPSGRYYDTDVVEFRKKHPIACNLASFSL